MAIGTPSAYLRYLYAGYHCKAAQHHVSGKPQAPRGKTLHHASKRCYYIVQFKGKFATSRHFIGAQEL